MAAQQDEEINCIANLHKDQVCGGGRKYSKGLQGMLQPLTSSKGRSEMHKGGLDRGFKESINGPRRG